MATYLIGLDGGGSHTEGMLCGENGVLIKRLQGGPSSSGTHFDQALTHLGRLISELTCDLSQDDEVLCLYAGISGCGGEPNRTHYRQRLTALFPHIRRIEVDGDTLTPAYSIGKTKNTVVVTCGTGCIAVAQTEKDVFRVDGYGYLLGDDGGGFSIGRDVIRAVLQEQDGRGKPTLLTKLFWERHGTSALSALISVNQGGKQEIASHAPLAFEAAAQGDQVAKDILNRASEAICHTVQAAARHLSVRPIPVVMGGSIWTAGDGWIKKRVRETLGSDYEWFFPDKPGAYGAVIRAAELACISDFIIKEEGEGT